MSEHYRISLPPPVAPAGASLSFMYVTHRVVVCVLCVTTDEQNNHRASWHIYRYLTSIPNSLEALLDVQGMCVRETVGNSAV